MKAGNVSFEDEWIAKIVMRLESYFGDGYVPAFLASLFGGVVRRILFKAKHLSAIEFLRTLLVAGFTITVLWPLMSLTDWPVKVRFALSLVIGFASYPILVHFNDMVPDVIKALVPEFVKKFLPNEKKKDVE